MCRVVKPNESMTALSNQMNTFLWILWRKKHFIFIVRGSLVAKVYKYRQKVPGLIPIDSIVPVYIFDQQH